MMRRLWNRALLSNPRRIIWCLSALSPVFVPHTPANLTLCNVELLFCLTMAADWVSWKESLVMAHTGRTWRLVD